MATKAVLDQYALDRSKSAADAANENSRVMAQAAMLINGAAATALIALLAKEKIDPSFLRVLPYSLAGYALGALFAWAGMFAMTESLDWFNAHWDADARGDTSEANRCLWWGRASWLTVQILFGFAALAFVIASGNIVVALNKVPTLVTLLPCVME